MKKIILFLLAISFVLLLSSPVSASRIELSRDWGWITMWSEHNYITKEDLVVNVHLRLSLSKDFYKYSDNYTFQFSPWEPEYVKKPAYFDMRIFKGCEQVDLRVFDLPYIKCEQGMELSNGSGFKDALVTLYNWEQKAHDITIFQNDSAKRWVNYDILISYKLDNFVENKDSKYFFSLKNTCLNSGNQKDKCPEKSSIWETVFLVNPDFEFQEFPEWAKKKIKRSGIEYINVKGTEGYDVKFSDTKETGFWIPLKWIFVGFILGLIPSLILYTIRNWKNIKKACKRKIKQISKK